MLQAIVALLIILMMLPFAGNASERLALNLTHKLNSAEILPEPKRGTDYFSAVDREAMLSAREKVLGDEAPTGLRVEFHGDKNSGYYQVLSKGHEAGREDISCREILSSSGSLSLKRVLCLKNRENEMVNLDPKLYVIDPPTEAPAGEPAPAQTPATPPVVEAASTH